MAVYVTLEFANDEEAKEFVKAQYNERVQVIYDDDDPFEITAEIRSVIKKPVKFCHCVKRQGWTRGKKFGWWVCASCGLPTELWASRNNWFAFMGTNLLPPELSTEYRPKGWERSPESWDFLIEYVGLSKEPEPHSGDWEYTQELKIYTND